MNIAINMDCGKKKLNKKGVRMMRITKETISAVAVYTHTHTDNFKYNKNNDFRGDIILPCVFVDTG